MSGDELSYLVAGECTVSIDVTLRCPICESPVETWFLVACDEDFYAQAPVVHLERYTENLRESASRVGAGFGQFEDLLERAQIAYEDHLGVGSMIYLRKIYEAITTEVATVAGISTTRLALAVATGWCGRFTRREVTGTVGACRPSQAICDSET